MQPTQISMAAYNLGAALQQLNIPHCKPEYATLRDNIRENLRRIGASIEMPETLADYEVAKYQLLPSVTGYLEQLRARLGGDVYSLPMFYFGYMPYDLVLASYFHLSTLGSQIDYFASVLQDLRIETPPASLARYLAKETAWLKEQTTSRDHLYFDDAFRVMSRLINRVTQLARAADKLTVAVHFDRLPYSSVFISYSTADQAFGEKLYGALRDAGIRVWFAPHDIRPGQKLLDQIHQAIDVHDKLLLVLSENSMRSDWVGTELLTARDRERREAVPILFPVRIAPFEAVKAWRLFDADTGRDLAREIREYFIPDFTNWKDDDAFLERTHELVAALLKEEIPLDG